ncbi:GGDEF domain-containing protein [Comamonas sp. Tr-654]|uniref:GGDEF domain-containing protein n=1 Tax=Comamonas sp. Tr-654 TaxID=2608341 RepID=UPI0014226255|nr:GGDEF domain-containing protein [Comamonas sp. Tr-654]
MTSSAPHQSVFLRDLRLATAHNLVTRAGGGDIRLPTDTPTHYLQALIDGLCALSLRDPLTGLANRRHFRSVIEREIDRVARSGETALLLMLDIDHFKQINDEHGHIAGDMVLQSVAQTLAEIIRPMDTLARFGGEEFAIVLPVCPAHQGRTVAERLRQAIEDNSIAVSSGQMLKVTVSIGGVYAQQWIRSTAQLWTERADRQLYLAKSAGRNCVCVEEPPDSTVSAEEKSLLFSPLHAASLEENVSDNTAPDVNTDAASQVITP